MSSLTDSIIEDYKKTIERLQQECTEKSELIFTLSTSFSQISSAMLDVKDLLERTSRNEVHNGITWHYPKNYQGELRGVVLRIKKVKEGAILPEYQTEGSSGMDLHAAIENTIIIPPLQRVFVPTGIAIELPMGYEAQVRARSGLSSKHGITLVNCVGTIDSDYRGEIIVPLINLSDSAYSIQPDERIAQMIISKYERVGIKEVSELNITHRAMGGFGSTGDI